MRRFSPGMTMAAFVLVGTMASAEQPQMPKPAPEMSQIAFFNGSWSCDGKMQATPMGPAGTMTSTAQIQTALDGFWQAGVIKGTSPGLPPFEGRFYVTYDPGAKHYLMMWMDSMGGWSRSSSSGWKADSMVYEGDSHMAGESMKTRETFSKGGAGSMKHVSEMQMNGKWMTTFEETCKKK